MNRSLSPSGALPPVPMDGDGGQLRKRRSAVHTKDMRPCAAFADVGDYRSVKTDFVTEVGEIAAFYTLQHDVFGDSLRDFGGLISRTARLIFDAEWNGTPDRRGSVPTFAHRVMNVVFLRPKKQMLWVNAKRRIALMQDVQSFGYRPIEERERRAMGKHPFAIWVRDAVSFVVGASLPNPASALVFNRVAKKSVVHGFGVAHWIGV